MTGWGLLGTHDPETRLRDIAARVGITERCAFGIVTDLAVAGYSVKQQDCRRDRYQMQEHLLLPEPTSREQAIGEVLAMLAAPGPPPAAEAGRC
jgi:hypothetical protein